jgi:hypothetical protein
MQLITTVIFWRWPSRGGIGVRHRGLVIQLESSASSIMHKKNIFIEKFNKNNCQYFA